MTGFALAVVASLVAGAAGAAVAPGAPDPGWGGDGVVVTDLGTTIPREVIVLDDGRVVVAGSDGNLGAVLVRYQPDGRLDRTFSGDGVAWARFGDDWGTYDDVAALPDGSLVAAGFLDRSETLGWDVVVARYRPDGSLDPTFGAGTGWISLTWGNVGSAEVAVQGDGRIVLATVGQGQLVTMRLTVDGGLDPTFGDGGIAEQPGSATGLVVLPDGRIVGAGRIDYAGHYGRAAVWALLPDGTPDAGFGDGGVVEVDPFGAGSTFSSLVLAGDRLVAAGAAGVGGGGDDVLVVRLGGDGSLDPTFGGDGVVTVPLGSGLSDAAVGVGVQPDGRVVVAANDDRTDGEAVAVLRFRPGGRPDRTFGGTGIVYVEAGQSAWHAMALGPAGALMLGRISPLVTVRVVL